MSDDLISRQSAIDCVFKRIDELRASPENRRKHVDIDVQGIARFIAKLPAVQPQEKTGKWEIAIGYDIQRTVMCDQCRKMAYEPSNYCPNCGAKMEV